MALLVCPDCKKKVSETAKSCPKCGFSLTPDAVQKIKKQDEGAKAIAVLLLVVGFLGYQGWKWFSPADKPSQSTPAPVLTKAQKAEQAALEKRIRQEDAQLNDKLAHATPAQLRTIFTKCRAGVDGVARNMKVMAAVVADESAPDSYQAMAAISQGSYRSIDERVAKFIKDRKGQTDYLAYLPDLTFTIISTEARLSGSEQVPHNYTCNIQPDMDVTAPRAR